jgi:hypothetical protein
MDRFRRFFKGSHKQGFLGKWVVEIFLVLAVLIPGTVQALELTGEHRYAVRPLESLEAAKQTTIANAVRLAIINSDLFREGTASVVDRPLLEDLVDTIISQSVENVQVIAHQVKGNTVHTKTRVVLNDQAMNTLIAQELGNTMTKEGEPAETRANRQNRALRILDVSEVSGGTVAIVFQALRRLDWMTTAYVGGLRDQSDVFITFYDTQGRPLRTDRFPARKAGADDRDVLVPGQIGMHQFPKPLTASSYEVWVAR